MVSGNAIAAVFPDTTHRWCMWHVMQNCRRHLGKRKDWGQIYSGLQHVLHDSLCVDEFENRWNDWAEKFDVWGVEWVKTMYAKRSRWCPVYFKTDFWAGMSSTQRSEGMHHYFKGYVNVNTGLTEFVERYGRAICRRIADEERERKKGIDRHAIDTSRHAFEPIFELLYTRAKYLELHAELIDMGGNVATKVSENDLEVTYEVESKSFRLGWARKTTHRVVLTKESCHVACECKNFEFRGILCAHALRIFWLVETPEVPEKYILERWRKDRPRKYITHTYPDASLMGPVSPPAQRFHDMKKLCEDMSAMVMHDEKLHDEVVGLLHNIKDRIREKTSLPAGICSFERGTVGRVYSRVNPEGISIGNGIGIAVVREDEVKDPVDKRGRGRAPSKRKVAYNERAGPSKAGRGGGRGSGKVNESPGVSQANFSPSTPVKMVFARGSSRMGRKGRATAFQMHCETGTFR